MGQPIRRDDGRWFDPDTLEEVAAPADDVQGWIDNHYGSQRDGSPLPLPRPGPQTASADPGVRESRRQEPAPIRELPRGPERLPEPKPEKESDGWGSFLGSMAAFTDSPVLADMARHRRDSGARQEKSAADSRREARDIERHDLDMRRGRADLDADQLKQQQVRDANDGGSAYSAAVRDGAVTNLKAQAARIDPKNPLAAEIGGLADRLSTGRLSAMAVTDLLKNMGGVGDDIASDAHKKAQLAMGWASQAESNRAHLAGEAEDVRHHQASEGQEGEQEIKVRMAAQEKLNQEINDKEQGLHQFDDIERIKTGTDPKTGKKTGKGVNTGWLAHWWNKKVAEPNDLASADRVELGAAMARTFNAEIKQLGGSNVTEGEWARIKEQMPLPGDDDGVFVTKLRKAKAIAEEILAKRREQYQLNKAGQPFDRSKTAGRSVAQSDAADQDKQAHAWALANPKDPRAAAILKKLGTK